MIELSVVIPVYNCAGCLRELHTRLTASLVEVTPEYEIVLVDDRSTDGAWDVLRELAREDPRLRVVRLSRNFGQHAAITAGLARSTGNWTVVMDCDLQEPPEEIPRLYAKAQEGYEIVRAVREGRRRPAFRRISATIYRRMLSEREGRTRSSSRRSRSSRARSSTRSCCCVTATASTTSSWTGWASARRTITFAHAERAGDSPSTYGLRAPSASRWTGIVLPHDRRAALDRLRRLLRRRGRGRDGDATRSSRATSRTRHRATRACDRRPAAAAERVPSSSRWRRSGSTSARSSIRSSTARCTSIDEQIDGARLHSLDHDR